MPSYQDLIGDVIGYWTPEDGDQLIGTVLEVGWDREGVLAADIQPEDIQPEKAFPDKDSPDEGSPDESSPEGLPSGEASPGKAPQGKSPQGRVPQGRAPQSIAPLRVRIGDKFWKDWSEAGLSQGGPSRGDRVRITYKETPLMNPETSRAFESEAFEEAFKNESPKRGASEAEQKTTARYIVEVLGEKKGKDEIS